VIAKLTGIVDHMGETWAVVDVSGVGYLVFCSNRTLGRLNSGEAASLFIDTHVREDHIHLYGFWDASERDFFRLLISVQGVGAKVGLAILGVLGDDALMQALAAQDRNALTRTPGVGPKLAGRILSELKDKIGTMALGSVAQAGGGTSQSPAAATGMHGVVSEAVSALVNLGYSPSEALAIVSQVATDMGPEVEVKSLIQGALARLGPGGEQ
jgi:holliday junction DNA helicase RuvA